jgi:diguanylate cyclase (GGDEF)-like protein
VDVCLADDQVSRRHLVVGEVKQIDKRLSVQITDMNSTNGTIVNGRKIQTVWCCSGETVNLGETTLLFRLQHLKNQEDKADSLSLVSRDSLTGIYNRRAFDNILQIEQQRNFQQDKTYSVLMIDVDNLKEINDEYGHPAGDAVLISVATLFSVKIREGDFLARVGGDEFAVLLPGTGLLGSHSLALRLLKAMESTTAAGKYTGLKVSVSIGIAEGSLISSTIKELYCQADEALIQAKQSGRNRIAVYKPHP